MTDKLEQLKKEIEEAEVTAKAAYMEFKSASTAYQDAELEYNVGESLSTFRSLTDNEHNFLYNLRVCKEKKKINFDEACKIKETSARAALDAKKAYETELNKLEQLKKEMEEAQNVWEAASNELNKMTNKLAELQNEIDEIAILHDAKQDTYNVFNEAAKIYRAATLAAHRAYQTAYKSYNNELIKNNNNNES